ncbi:hypothetical protein HX793_25450 [Pseudomonas reactans]|uniref:Imm50 family immunity protein n=1 Tax=Pseudomonas reactans TaxID=117680 RepID=UPI0015A0389B|nr:Imm50 family immunity protein [Pseudomonas reactans]NWC87971.1 hypothetical protein [Pseudomonas reactans]NWD33140.1 hypothetical protein [Pseudomonas reactans]
MKNWNELDNSTLFSKIFTYPVEIGKISLFSLRIENNQSCINLNFDISEFPDNLPEKWKNKGYTMCSVGIICNDIEHLKILNIPKHEEFTVRINVDDNYHTFEAISENASIKFNAKSIKLSGPNVYMNAASNHHFKTTIITTHEN